MDAVRVEGVYKDFIVGENTVSVLKGINFHLELGKLHMIVGSSGCGKTVLISIIAGVLSPTKGEVHVLDTCITGLLDEEKTLFRRHAMGFVFQQYNLIPSLTAAENVALPLIAAGVPFYVALEKAKRILHTIAMDAHMEKLPSQLSGGQQQRIAIARALVHEPKIVICDEPTAALDSLSGMAIMQLLREIANDVGRTVIIVTHDERVYYLADNIIRFADGYLTSQEQITATGGKHEISLG